MMGERAGEDGVLCCEGFEFVGGGTIALMIVAAVVAVVVVVVVLGDTVGVAFSDGGVAEGSFTVEKRREVVEGEDTVAVEK